MQQGQVKVYYFVETSKGSGQKPNGSTIFMIGSISKTFTATLLALDVQQHSVELGDNLQKYVPTGVTVPTFDGQPEQITLESLATHSSGLPRNPVVPAGSARNFTSDQLFQGLNQTTLLSTPGSKFLYSNYGYSLLGQALARVGNKSWGELNYQEICSPLGMVDTKIGSQLSGDQLGRRAQGYGNDGAPAPYPMQAFPAGNPAGGLYSTLEDMVKYLSFSMGLTNSSLNTLRPMLFQPYHQAGPDGKVGLGWQINPLSGTNNNIIWKSGSTGGFNSYIGFIPETGNGVVLLLNFLSPDKLKDLAQLILTFLVQHPATANPLQIPKVIPSSQNPVQGPGPVEHPQNIPVKQ